MDKSVSLSSLWLRRPPLFNLFLLFCFQIYTDINNFNSWISTCLCWYINEYLCSKNFERRWQIFMDLTSNLSYTVITERQQKWLLMTFPRSKSSRHMSPLILDSGYLYSADGSIEDCTMVFSNTFPVQHSLAVINTEGW